MGFFFSNMAVSAFVAVTSLLMFVAFIRPLIMLRLYFVCRPIITPFSLLQYTLFGMTPIGMPYLLIVTLGGVASSFGRGARICPGSIGWVYLYLIFAIPAAILSPSIALILSSLSRIGVGIGVYLIAYNYINSFKNVKFVLYSIVVYSVVVPFIYGFYQFVTATGNAFTHAFHDPRRIASVFTQYNAYGEYLNIVIFLLISMVMSDRFQKQKKWLYLILGVAVTQSLLAQNRGAWLGMVGGLLFGMFMYRGVIKIKFLLIGGSLLGFLGGAYILQRFAALTRKTDYGGSQNTLEGRLEYYGSLLDQVMESPFVGKGLGYVEGILGHKAAPHNDYLWLLLETGILAVLMYIFFQLSNVFMHVRNRNNKNWRWLQLSLGSISIYFAVHAFFQNIIWNPSIFPFFMVCLGMSAKLMKIPEDFPEEKAGK